MVAELLGADQAACKRNMITWKKNDQVCISLTLSDQSAVHMTNFSVQFSADTFCHRLKPTISSKPLNPLSVFLLRLRFGFG